MAELENVHRGEVAFPHLDDADDFAPVVVFIVVGQRRLDGALVFVGILTFIGQRRRIAVAA